MTSAIRNLVVCGVTAFGAITASGQSAVISAASAPGARAGAADIELRAKVVELDRVGRQVTLRTSNGKTETVDVPDTVKNFDQMQVGDTLVIRYRAATLVTLDPAAAGGIREHVESTSVASAPLGAMPAATSMRTVTVLAVVQAIDTKHRKVTLRGAKRTLVLDVGDDIDLKKVKVGQEVRAAFVESLALNVERSEPAK